MCLITGASGGLGRAVGEALARQGATVLLSARGRVQGEIAAAAIAGAGDVRALPVGLDVAEQASASAAAAAIRHGFGRLDVLINNAAAYVDWSKTVTAAELDRSRAVMDQCRLADGGQPGGDGRRAGIWPERCPSPAPSVTSVSPAAASGPAGEDSGSLGLLWGT